MTAEMIPHELIMPRSHETTEGNKTGSWRFLRPRYENKTSPCSAACPAGEDIAMIEMLAGQGLFKEAWETILRENPLPGTCGRVCFHPCEGVCNRKDFDAPVAVHGVERFLADAAVRNDLKPALERRPRQSHAVAVVGSGPAGLSAAWFLGLLGYGCDVYEALPEAGGVLRWGIPEYRLPAPVLNVEISRIESGGARILRGRPVTVESLKRLRKDYDAVFLGCGLSRGATLRIPGESQDSVKDGLAFLRCVRAGEAPPCDGLSAVIGGGNTAVDIARTVARLGGKAAILYRRRRGDMPAFRDEVAMALEEGVGLFELLAPEAIRPRGRRYGLALGKMRVEGRERDGRGRVVPTGETTEMEVERVFTATGVDVAQAWHRPPSGRGSGISLSHCVLVPGDRANPLVYGGDPVNETKNVTHAIASGKQAAMALDTFFHEGMEAVEARLAGCRVGNGPALSMEIYLGGPRRLRSSHVVQPGEINTDYFRFGERMTQPRLLAEERIDSFDEIDLRVSAGTSIREAGRCFNCGLCNQCDNCYVFCPDVAVRRGRDMKDRHIDYDYCKGCGLCAAECPRNAVTLGKEDAP